MSLEIVEIYPSHLYAVKQIDEEANEYEKSFSCWTDLDYLIAYFQTNGSLLRSEFWQKVPIPDDAEDLAQLVIEEAYDLQGLIEQIAENSSNGELPDLDSYFQPLGGKYNVLREYIPQKGYGTNNPTMLRLYAIRIEVNCYLIVYGGIKLTKEIQGTPLLNRELFPKIDNVLQYLVSNGIIDKEDLIE